MKIDEYREQIDEIDGKIVELFNQRMQVAKKIGEEKKLLNLSIANKSRERIVLERAVERADDEVKRYCKILYCTMLDISKSYQREFENVGGSLEQAVAYALEETPKEFPYMTTVACQGVAGAFSDNATNKLFSLPKTTYFRTFDGVFNAVEKGLCDYGILPIENSSAGSVVAVYEAMQKYKFFIARSIKLRVHHCLVGNAEADPKNVKEIISHEQAINQCSQFLAKYKNAKITICENTAIASQIVKESNRKDLFAIASQESAELYDLKVFESRIQNSDNNYTRFICISKNMQIFEGADRISIMVALPNEAGSLYNFITKFATQDINLLKIESRPIVGSDFEFLFYFDFEGSLKNQKVAKMLGEMQNTAMLTLLGNYREI